MILIFGGAYQGKSDFAKKTFGLSGSDISFCHEIKTAGADGDSSRPDENFGIDFSVRAIHGLENAFLSMVRAGVEPRDFLAAHVDELHDKILMINDISQGIVPVDPTLRTWREAVGRASLWLASESDEVYRVFCGIGEKLR